ncbi:TPA: helix-turn-helix domain-containing protein [Salmonella enterica subsp. enterica serovar Muenchen]
MKTFDGFSLEPTDAFSNINLLLEAGMLLAASTNEGTEEIGDIVIGIAKKYSYTAYQKTTKPTATTDYIPYNIGNRIQIARENLGMSEDDLAEKLDIHPGDVLTWEDGTDQPLAGMIIPLANALKCDPMWLLTGESSNHQVSADSGK